MYETAMSPRTTAS